MITTINYLLIAGVLQGFVFIVFTLIIKKKMSRVILYLNLCVLFISINNLQASLIEWGYKSNDFYLERLLVPWYVLVMPMFYMFLTNFLKVNNVFRNILKLTIYIFIFELIFRSLIILFLYLAGPSFEYIIQDYTAYEEIANLSFTLIVFYYCWYIVFKRPESYAYIKMIDKVNWIKTFLKLGALILGFWLVAVIISNISGDKQAYYPLRLATSVLIYWISYQGFLRYQIVEDKILLGRFLKVRNGLSSPIDDVNLSKTDFINDSHFRQFGEIDSYIIKKLKFLDPYLSMEGLAKELGLSPSHLSKLINNYSGFNFSDYINYLRIEQAKKMLSDDSYKYYTNVAIGIESGFNSKSSFYSAFKKFTSETPSTFKEFLVVS